jgi:hypothetical protein
MKKTISILSMLLTCASYASGPAEDSSDIVSGNVCTAIESALLNKCHSVTSKRGKDVANLGIVEISLNPVTSGSFPLLIEGISDNGGMNTVFRLIPSKDNKTCIIAKPEEEQITKNKIALDTVRGEVVEAGPIQLVYKAVSCPSSK